MGEWRPGNTIMKIPLKDHTLEITGKDIQVYNSERILLIVRMRDIKAITPREENSICIYYDKIGCHPFRPDRKIYELDKSQPSSLQVCRQILNKLANIGLVQKNEKGLLCIKHNEEILGVFPNVRIHKNFGVLYITSLRIVHETDIGVLMDMDYYDMVHVREQSENTIEIIWEHDVSSLKDPIFSSKITMSSKSDRKVAYLRITRHIAGVDSVNKIFYKLDKDFGSLDCDKIYDLARNSDKDFDKYIFILSLLSCGYVSDDFTDHEKDLILACKLLEFDEKLVMTMTNEEVRQRNFSTRYEYFSDRIVKEFDLDEDNILDYVERCLKSDQTPDQTQRDIQSRHSEMMNAIRLTNKIYAESLRYYDKRVMILYKEWCKSNPLQNFTDEYGNEWVNYLLNKLDTPKGHHPIGDYYPSYHNLKSMLEIRDKSRYTLTNFSAPDHIEPRDIYNNCWYDKQHEMWYVQDSDLGYILQNIADSNPDRSEAMVGRRVWGFKKDRVNMFCGFPSVLQESIYKEKAITITSSRVTGQTMRRLFSDTLNYILPILRDSDIIPEMEIKYGSMFYKTSELKYIINPLGDYDILTPQMAKFKNKRYDFADIPLNERVRRALFVLETGLRFNPHAPLEPSTIKVPNPYPNTFYDERFEYV